MLENSNRHNSSWPVERYNNNNNEGFVFHISSRQDENTVEMLAYIQELGGWCIE